MCGIQRECPVKKSFVLDFAILTYSNFIQSCHNYQFIHNR
jgi:hypothetical protein